MNYNSDSTGVINTIIFYMSFTHMRVLEINEGMVSFECSYELSRDACGRVTEVGYDYFKAGLSRCKSYIKYSDEKGSVRIKASSEEVTVFLEETILCHYSYNEKTLICQEVELPF